MQSHSQPLQAHQVSVKAEPVYQSVKAEPVYQSVANPSMVIMPPPSQPLHTNFGNLPQNNPALAHTAMMASGGLKRRISVGHVISGTGAVTMSSPSPLMEHAMVNSSNGMGTPVTAFATIPGSNMQGTRDPSAEPHTGPPIVGSTAPMPSPSLSSAIAVTPGTPTANPKNPKKARHSVTSLTLPGSTNKTLAGGNPSATPAPRNRKGSGKKDSSKRKDSMMDDHDPAKVGTPKDAPVTVTTPNHVGSPGISVSTPHQVGGARMTSVKGSPLQTASPALASAVAPSVGGDPNNNNNNSNTPAQDANHQVIFAAGPEFTHARQPPPHGYENMPNYYTNNTTPHQVTMLNSTDGMTNGLNSMDTSFLSQNSVNLEQGTGNFDGEWDLDNYILDPAELNGQDLDVSSGLMTSTTV